MSDPAKSEDIEDVLSSIRRLVSEHQPGPDGSAPKPPSGGDDGDRPDKLVLTPAHRVTDPEDPWARVSPQLPDDAPAERAAEEAEAPAEEARDPGLSDGANWAEALWGDSGAETGAEERRAEAAESAGTMTGAEVSEEAAEAVDEAAAETETAIDDATEAADQADATDEPDASDLDDVAAYVQPPEAEFEWQMPGSLADTDAFEAADETAEAEAEAGTEAAPAIPTAAAEGDEVAEAADHDVPEISAAETEADVSAAEATPETSGPEDEAPAWRADDTLASWDEVGIAAAGDGAAEPAPFESETGDDNWPDAAGGDAAMNMAALRGARPGPETAPEAAPEVDAAPADADAAPVETPAAMGAEPTDEAWDAPTPEEDDIFADPIDHAEETAVDNDAAAYQAAETAPWEAPAEAAPEPEPEPEPEVEPQATATFFAHRSAGERVVDLGARLDEPKGDDALEDVEDLGDAEGAFTFPDREEGILDEETLREIIAEVVREELQGALGQRITRNVRKMVRREIRLALAAEELE